MINISTFSLFRSHTIDNDHVLGRASKDCKKQNPYKAGLPDDTNSHIKTIYIYMATKNNNCILI